MFVLKAARSSTKMSRIKWWLILLSRIMAIAVFVLALAKPMVGGWLGWRLSGAPDTILLLLDRSASMEARHSPGRSKRVQAISLVSEAGSETASTSRGVLIDNASLSPEDIPAWSVLDEMEKTKATDTAASVPAMFRKALDYILDNDTGDTEVWLASDMQASNWEMDNPAWGEIDAGFKALPAAASFRVLALDAPAKGNAYLELRGVLTTPSAKGPKRELALEISSGGRAGEIPLTLDDGTSTRQITARLDAGVARIRVPLPPRGEKDKVTYGRVILPPDANPNDNTAYFAAAPPVMEKAAVLSKNKEIARILLAAAAPEGEPAFQKAVPFSSASTLLETPLADTALVIWQAPPPSAEAGKKLAEFAESGGVVLFLPPGETVSAASAEFKWSSIETASGDKKTKGLAVGTWNRDEGPLADTLSGIPLPLDDLRFTRLQRPDIPLSGTDILASDTKGHPLFLEKRIGDGMFVYCSSLPSSDWSNLGDGLVLVPLIRRLARRGAARLSPIAFKECGKWKPGSSETTLLFPAPKDNEPLASVPVKAGVYQDGDKIVVLNRPVKEDIPARISSGEIGKLLPSNKVHAFSDSGDGKGGKMAGMWWTLIALALAFLTLEGFLCRPERLKNADAPA